MKALCKKNFNILTKFFNVAIIVLIMRVDRMHILPLRPEDEEKLKPAKRRG